MPSENIHPLFYVLEWFVAPLVMYLLLFRWRDRLNILHMPWADLVALLVLADVALSIHVAQIPGAFTSLMGYEPKLRAELHHWISVGIAGLLLCRIQVKWLEKRIRDIVIDHTSVGWPKFNSTEHFARSEIFTQPRWRAFTRFWSISVAIAALVISLHVVLLGTRIPELNPDRAINNALFVGWVTLAAFLGSWLLSVAFFLSGYCRLRRIAA